MKQLVPFLLPVMFLVACSQHGDYKAIRKQVIEVHDEVMHKGEALIRNKMKLDTALTRLAFLKKQQPGLDTLKAREEMTKLIRDLNQADEQMSDWMHQFEPDVNGKPDQQAARYFQQELLKIKTLDSLYDKSISASNEYLSKLEGK